MSDKSQIHWTESTWNPVTGCSHVSPGCVNCYAEKLSLRFGHSKVPWTAQNAKQNVVLHPDRLDQPLRWKRPRRIFVNSMSDLFHELVPFEFIDQVFDVMESCPRHTFQVLTKRPERMRDYMRDPLTPHRIARLRVAREVQGAIDALPYELREIPEWTGYFVDNRGTVFTTSGSSRCCYCGEPITGHGLKRYCGEKCRQISWYHRKRGRKDPFETEMVALSPDVGEQGHQRVTLYSDGQASIRFLVHRLVLEVFGRRPLNDEQACHRDGNPANNALPNLHWGSQSDNWDDRRLHGNYQSHTKVTREQVEEIKRYAKTTTAWKEIGRWYGIGATQVRNIVEGEQWQVPTPIPWPPPNCWLGTSVEDQRRADERIPHLLNTPAAVRFLSAEPLLGELYLERWLAPDLRGTLAEIGWVIVGGESGPSYRPMDTKWAGIIRDECQFYNVPFFFKQSAGSRPGQGRELDGRLWEEYPDLTPLEAVV